MPPDLAAEAARRRAELVEAVANVDEQLGELFLMEEPIDEHTLREAVRRATVSPLRSCLCTRLACCVAGPPPARARFVQQLRSQRASQGFAMRVGGVLGFLGV